MKCAITLNNGLDIHVGDLFWGYVHQHSRGGWSFYNRGEPISYEQTLELKLVKLTIYQFNVSPCCGHMILPIPGRELDYRIDLAAEAFGCIHHVSAVPEDFLTTLFPTKEEAEEAFAKFVHAKTQEHIGRLNQEIQTAMDRLTNLK